MLNWIVWIGIVWLNWIVWNRNDFKKLNYVLKLNCIVWNVTVFDIETELFNIELLWHLTVGKQNLYLY